MAITTTLYNAHIKAGAKFIDFAGFLLPVQYDGIIKEHLWCRNNCAVFDTSHMAKFIFRGENVSSQIGMLFTININRMKSGQCKYCFLLNEKGTIIDDVIIYKFQENEFMIVSNASTKSKVKNWYVSHTENTEIIDADEYLDKIDIQGPFSQDVINEQPGIDLSKLSFYNFMECSIFGVSSIISYTGYTGGKGYEIYINKNLTEKLWETLLKDERVKPAGLGARDSLRLEAGLPLYGNELDETTTPIEAGLKEFVDFSHSFIGKNALVNSMPGKKMVFLVSETRQSPRHGYRIFFRDEDIGYVTSGCFSPCIQKGIGIGYVRKDITLTENVILKDAGNHSKILCRIVSKKHLTEMAGITK